MKCLLPLTMTAMLSSFILAVPTPYKEPHQETQRIAQEGQKRVTEESIPTSGCDGFIDVFALDGDMSRLNDYIDRLNGYVTSRRFKSERFEQDISDLLAEHSTMRMAARAQSSTKEFVLKYKYAGRLLKAMGDSTALLRDLRGSDDPGGLWLYQLIQLNARACVLFDYQGKLDLANKKNTDRTLAILQSFLCLQKTFNKLSGVSAGVARMFEVQTARLRKLFQLSGHA
ncbi:hypothetical protein JCM33374_g1673 [Metschnikowia sp. JCM 33374]|nr:hypothetical protein JCM33374_g1673 [Metschnikowia sp. JCM 33374]